MKHVVTFLVGAMISGVSAAAQQGPSVDPRLSRYASTADSVRLPDGRMIHVVCMGKGSPTVILTAGLGDWAVAWSMVQPEIASTTRVCAWDRPGFGLSDARPQPQSVATTTADLEATLARQSIPGPFILVGHSAGGFESLLYADRHPSQVVGMVLIDPTVPGQTELMKSVASALAASNETYMTEVAKLIRRCVVELRAAGRTTSPECDIPMPPNYPADLVKGLRVQYARPAQGEGVASFYENWTLSGQQVINPARSYGSMPLIVLTATDSPPSPPGTSTEVVEQGRLYLDAFSREHDKLAALSTRGINSRVPGTSHYIQSIKPQVVIDAVEAIVAEARTARLVRRSQAGKSQ
jgi:pimeloyl-ACP methyl ester carboxylesterase